MYLGIAVPTHTARVFLRYEHSKHAFSMHFDNKSSIECSPSCPTIMCSCPQILVYTGTCTRHIESRTHAHEKRGKRPLLIFRIFGRVPPAQCSQSKCTAGTQHAAIRGGTAAIRGGGAAAIRGGNDPRRRPSEAAATQGDSSPRRNRGGGAIRGGGTSGDDRRRQRSKAVVSR